MTSLRPISAQQLSNAIQEHWKLAETAIPNLLNASQNRLERKNVKTVDVVRGQTEKANLQEPSQHGKVAVMRLACRILAFATLGPMAQTDR